MVDSHDMRSLLQSLTESSEKNKFNEDKLAKLVKQNVILEHEKNNISAQLEDSITNARELQNQLKQYTKKGQDTQTKILKERVAKLEKTITENERNYKMKLNYMKNPHLLHLPDNIVQGEQLKAEHAEMKTKLSQITQERDKASVYAKRIQKEKEELKLSADKRDRENDNTIERITSEAEVLSRKVDDLDEQNKLLNTGWQREVLKSSSLENDITHLNLTLKENADVHYKELLSEQEKYLHMEETLAKVKDESIKQQGELNRITNSNELELSRVRKLLEEANKQADKYKTESDQNRNHQTAQTNDTQKELEQMKKMIGCLTNYLSLYNADKDGSGAVVLVTQVKALLYMKDPSEQECGLNAIYNIISEKSREKIKKIEGLVGKVDGLTRSEYEYVSAAAKRAMAKIQAEKLNPRHGRGVDIKCTYFNLCKRFMLTLNIDAMYIDEMYNCCYCAYCHTARGDRSYYSRGIPSKEYGIPVGWARFALSVNEGKATAQKIWDNWHISFHGTRKESLKNILEVGYLVNPGDVITGGRRIGVRPGHISESDSVRKIFMSPSIRYAGNECYASASSYTDPSRKKDYKARVVFQIRVEPKSYEVRAETINAISQIDPGYLNSELEWCTNQHGSTIIQGILIKVE